MSSPGKKGFWGGALFTQGLKMLGDFITRCLLLVLGYAYPAFECYKTVERNMVGIEELRFWCQYWIIIASLTVLERIADVFISWLPMYSEMKLAFVLYLWYPKTKGTGHVYDALLRPYVEKHETDIDSKLLEWRVRLWDLAIFYWNNCTELGQSAFFTVLQHLSGQSARFPTSSTKTTTHKNDQEGQGAHLPPPIVSSAFREHINMQANQQSNHNKWPPAPSAPPAPNGNGYKTPYAYVEDITSPDSSENYQKGILHQAGSRFRRFLHNM